MTTTNSIIIIFLLIIMFICIYYAFAYDVKFMKNCNGIVFKKKSKLEEE